MIVEKEKRIEDLTREVNTLNGFAHYFKTAEVKQIEAPAEEKKSRGTKESLVVKKIVF